MNILIYIPELSQKKGGIKQYSIGLLNLLSGDHSNKYFIYHNNNDADVLNVILCNPQLHLIQDSDVILEKSELIEKKGNYIKQKLQSAKNRVVRKFKAQKEKVKLSFIDTLCTQFKINVIHCPFQYIPITNKVKLITTLHDVQEIHFPKYFTAEERAYRANAYLDFLRRADIVIVSYKHVKSDLIKYFNVAEEKICVLLLRMHNLWVNKFSESDIIDLSYLKLPDKFLLYPANTWKHKNHLRLIEAVAIAKEKYREVINVVCTGYKNEHFEEIETLLIKLNMSNQVLFTGVLEEKELYSIYKNCMGVIIPTIYEAGSFPLYECILMNVPVVCSNVTSLPDTIGADEYVFNPFDVEDIAKKMINIWGNADFRENNRKQLLIQVKHILENNPLPILQEIYALLDT